MAPRLTARERADLLARRLEAMRADLARLRAQVVEVHHTDPVVAPRALFYLDAAAGELAGAQLVLAARARESP